jgi:uncharacterized protein with von Willebrand factor type A (vWA) domain
MSEGIRRGQIYQLAKILRKEGLSIHVQQMGSMLRGIACFPIPTLHDIYSTGRATLCRCREDIQIFDRCFWSVFDKSPLIDKCEPKTSQGGFPNIEQARSQEEVDTDGGSTEIIAERGRATDHQGAEKNEEPDQRKSHGLGGTAQFDILRRRDVATLSDAERKEVLSVAAELTGFDISRSSMRRSCASIGAIDVVRTVRKALARAGDPERIYRHKLDRRRRRSIVLVDVSGSMARYSELFLRFAYALVRAHPQSSEIFTLGTRLTRVTLPLKVADPDKALSLAASEILDWQGGTRLGDQLKVFLDRWGQRGLARGAVVIIASDGWERGDCALLVRQMERLGRLAYRTIWCNPYKSTLGFEPTARGMRAVLPYVDEFVGGNSLDELKELGSKVTRNRRGRRAPTQPRKSFWRIGPNGAGSPDY